MEKLKDLITSLEKIIKDGEEVTFDEKELLLIYRNTCQEFVDKAVEPKEDFIFLVSSAVSLFNSKKG